MSTVASKTRLADALQWRYAVKKMNGQGVSEEKVERILDAIQLSPSGIGLQPYTVLVITDPELKKQILPIANNQQQMVDSSHLLVFAAWDTITEERVTDFLQSNIDIRKVSMESLQRYRDILMGMTKREAEANYNWAARQAYIAFGIAIVAAAEEGVDATPMEGFNPVALDELLGLDKIGLRSVTLLPLGTRDAVNDWAAALPKVRRAKDKLFIRK
ncbi:MAG TPA: NAD(P)H-dependent oxidoreductase [Bacteroidia bacterium]|jgi:nitroreductase|nr:NAD(P)H-dependent oxidoreductase [Bacteroidia bacterium]